MIEIIHPAIHRRREQLNTFHEGTPFECTTHSLDPLTGETRTNRLSDEIVDELGGGFYGPVFSLKNHPDMVLKLTQPKRPSREAGRLANWAVLSGRWDFPSQISEAVIRAEQQGGNIFRELIQAATRGDITAPAYNMYTRFDDGVGYAHFIETMHCRPPRFDKGISEVARIWQAQKRITRIGTEFGLEVIGQFNQGNPLGFDNLKIGDDGSVVAIDTLECV